MPGSTPGSAPGSTLGSEPTRIVVEQVDPTLSYRLRRDVLRPGARLEDMGLFDEGQATVAVFGAIDTETGELVGTASIHREPPPDPLSVELRPGPELASWRLRGMATREDLRGLGIGARVLQACIDHVGRQGGGLVWCNARVPAQRFYEREGFSSFGEEFDSLAIPHVVMWRWVEPTATDSIASEAAR